MSGPDIVDRLLGIATMLRKMGFVSGDDCDEAAATITALQAEVERLQSENAYLRGKVEGHVIARIALERTKP